MKNIELSEELFLKIEKELHALGFQTVQDYVIDLLEKKFNVEESFSADEEQKVKERLRSLGYLD